MKQKTSSLKKNRILEYIAFLYLKLFITSLQEGGEENKKHEIHWLARVCSVGVKGMHHTEILPAYFITV